MNEQICCITNVGEIAWNEWENDDSNFFWALFSAYKKNRAIFIHILLSIHSSVASYKCFKKLISDIWKHWS